MEGGFLALMLFLVPAAPGAAAIHEEPIDADEVPTLEGIVVLEDCGDGTRDPGRSKCIGRIITELCIVSMGATAAGMAGSPMPGPLFFAVGSLAGERGTLMPWSRKASIISQTNGLQY
ncbi:hypothetical protein F5Y04DRAFT_279309 [Hypomontagnella monticulosa]|nr:hypothetical protein F5Y04DRAFT_279309 [Hypomontagnella monticulosa]